MAWNDNLEEGSAAHRIASSSHRKIRVLAGPGTGKSFAMKRRVARILETNEAPAKKVLAVTFTRVAAEDLHRELVSLGVAGANQLKGKTLHSLAMSILTRNHVLRSLGRTPRPLNKFEIEPLLADLSPIHGKKHARKKRMLAYGAAWSRLQTEEPGYVCTPQDQAFVDELVRWLRFHEAMLMDEVIPHLHQYLKANPGAPEREEFKHLLVDEYQDLNRAEQDALHFLGDSGSMCVIGDDDQSIYSFRHAHPEGIRQWATLYSADGHAIDECRRCPTRVVRMANALISRNANRISGRSMTERSENGEGQVMVCQYKTAEKEADAVAAKIKKLVDDGVSPGEIIVLAQRGAFATPIFDRLRKQNIPTKSYYAESELDTLKAQERFALLKLLLNNEDRVALRWLLGQGVADWRMKSYKRIMAHSYSNGISPWNILSALDAGSLSIPHTSSLVERFREIREEISSLGTIRDINVFISQWLPESDDTKLLAETVSKCKEGAETASELYEALYERITHPEMPLEISEVRIMSLHKSKGLSSPFVFIVGCTEGLLPASVDSGASEAERDAKLEEDRRLFYVGITRVKAIPGLRSGYLALTYSQTMPAADAFSNQIVPVEVIRGTAILQPSRFISEMAPHIPNAEYDRPL